MNYHLDKITNEALALTDEERSSLIEVLSESLNLPPSASDRELRLRMESIDSGTEHGLSHQDVMDEIRRSLI